MTDKDTHRSQALTNRLACQAEADQFRVTAHAHREMVEERTWLADVLSVLRRARLVENYPEHKRGPCCLVCGRDEAGRYLHVVCTTTLEIAVIITVYVPKLPKWETPLMRGRER